MKPENIFTRGLPFAALLLLAACQSASTKSHEAICETGAATNQQQLSIDSGTLAGATCLLVNQEGEWPLAATPGALSVTRSRTPLQVTCKKAGYLDATQTVQSVATDKSVVNLIGVGLLGSAVTTVDNPYEYPATISIPMTSVDMNTKPDAVSIEPAP